MNRLEWSGLYADSWGDDLVPEAFAHPAKYSRGLIRQIYAHMLAENMIAPGNVIGDPFGGIAAGALDAMLNGLHWRGVELEPRFVALGNDNIALWASRYAPHFPRWGTAALVQGDSRGFAGIVGGLAGVVSSPPYASGEKGHPSLGSVNRDDWGTDGRDIAGRRGVDGNYGSTPGQLGSMPAGDLDAVVSSPAYGDTVKKGDGPGARWDAKTHPGNPAKISSATSYGDTPGQVGRLDAVISSNPFEASMNSTDEKFIVKHLNDIGRDPFSNGALSLRGTYGTTSGNTGTTTGETFWTASRAIVEQVHMALKPGGYVAWVTGDFVRKGQRVLFGKQWMTLCQACGFEAHTWAIAWKTEHHGTQLGFFEDVERRTDRVSFFRRLANERNPAAAILNEDVIIMRRADD